VALRKTSRSPREFVTPMQRIYAGPSPATETGFWRRLLRRL
jgi:hypothetical protein